MLQYHKVAQEIAIVLAADNIFYYRLLKFLSFIF